MDARKEKLTWPSLCIQVLGMGRPRKQPAERKAKVLCHRITQAEYRVIREAAKRAGLKVPAYCRAKLLKGLQP
jgi:hypothetical protein